MFDNKKLMVKSAHKTTLSYLATHNPSLVDNFRKFKNVFGEIKYYKVNSISRHYQETVVWTDENQEHFVVYEYGVIVKNEILCHNTSIFSTWNFNTYSEFSEWCYCNRKDRIINSIKKKTLAKLHNSMQKKLKVTKIQENKIKKI